MSGVNWIEARSILTPTGGFLKAGYTHSLNPYSGCAYAQTACGTFCYAQHNHWVTQGRPWGLYGAKRDAAGLYARGHDRERRAGRPLRIYMSSSTDPYVPQEKTLRVTRGVLEAMRERPPDVLVLQTHATLVERDIELLVELSGRCGLWLSVTVETDLDPVPGLPRHASPPARRIEVLRRFRQAGVRTQATVSPLLPVGDVEGFAADLDAACDRVILDHFLLGDGSGGTRTQRTPLIGLLEANGFGAWTQVAALDAVAETFRRVLGPQRVLLSEAGFNAV